MLGAWSEAEAHTTRELNGRCQSRTPMPAAACLGRRASDSFYCFSQSRSDNDSDVCEQPGFTASRQGDKNVVQG